MMYACVQMTTPESRRAQADRRSSFLDNISVRTEEERQQREQKKTKAREGGGREKGGRGRTLKVGKTATVRKPTGVSG